MTSAPITKQLKDPDTEQVRRNFEERIRQLSLRNAPHVISGVSLADSTIVLVAHGLGRTPKFYSVSPPRNASTGGAIRDRRDASATYDLSKYLVLEATGWGATITVDVMVF